MKKTPQFLTAIFLLLLCHHSVQAATPSQFIGMNIPAEVIGNALQKILPLELDGNSSRLEGKITIVDISALQLHNNKISSHLDLQGDDLNLITTVGNQDIHLKLGSARIGVDCDAELRYDAAEQTLYIRPIARETQSTEALQNGDIGQALLLFLNGREFPLVMEDIQPIITEASDKIITIKTRIADITSVEGALQLSLDPVVTAVPKK
jgi:hypothetical protein